MSTQVTRAAKLLEDIVQTVNESMPALSDTTPGSETKLRWIAERNTRVNNLVALVSAIQVKDAVDGLDSTLDRIQRAVEQLPQA